MIQAQNEMDEKNDIKEGIDQVKGTKLLQHPKRYKVKMVAREENTKLFKMLKQQRNSIHAEKERKTQLKASKEEPDDIVDSDEEPERFDPSERFLTGPK